MEHEHDDAHPQAQIKLRTRSRQRYIVKKEASLAALPPPVRDAEFEAVDIIDEDAIKRRFGGFVRSLHEFLNGSECLAEVQRARRRWRGRVASPDAFGNLASDPRHWYTFNHGGRTEAQFNIGLYPTHMRVGLGFEFTLKKGGDPTTVHFAYACFASLVRGARQDFERFVADNDLEVEWVGSGGGKLEFVPTDRAVAWLLNPPKEPQWIFLGRLLRRGSDSQVLEDPRRLGDVMQTVLCGFRPVWEQTQVLAHAK